MAGFRNTSQISYSSLPVPTLPVPPPGGILYPQGLPTSTSPDAIAQNAVNSPVALASWQGLGTGPEFSISNYEANLDPQVRDNEQLFLRQLSPFIIRLEPPLAYGAAGGTTNIAAGQIAVGAYDTANANSQSYTQARNTISRMGLNTVPTASQTNPATISLNSPSSAIKGTKTGGISTDTTTVDKLGAPAIANFQTAVDIAQQLANSLKMPPLVLLINPASMKTSYEKLQQFTERTRYGFVFHAHGEEQPKLSITAKCGGFYSGSRGLQYASKRDSLAWQNLMGMFHFYKNNGYLYDNLGQSNAHYFIGALSIQYDQWIYYGNMESFTWTYDEKQQQGAIDFQIEFTVSSMADNASSLTTVGPLSSPTASPSDPRWLGQQNLSGQSIVGNQTPPGFQFNLPVVSVYPQITNPSANRPISNALNALVPGAVRPLFPGLGTVPPQGGIGTLGFQQPIVTIGPGGRTVVGTTPAGGNPFGVP